MWKVPDRVRLIREAPDVPFPVGSAGTVVDVHIDEPPVYFVEFDPVDSVHLDDGLETPMFYVVQEDDLELVKSYRRRERTE